MLFSHLGLHKDVLRTLAQLAYTEPTPIQEQAIPVLLGGRDLLASAQTGTGKTAGFALPILHRLAVKTENPSVSAISALILTPTRELAIQVEEKIRLYRGTLPITSCVIIGGIPMAAQTAALKKKVDILVATPGRLLDHIAQHHVDLSQVSTLVLDEVDRMLDMGFIQDIRRILSHLPKKRQNALFSATLSLEIKRLADTLLQNSCVIEADPLNAPARTVTQTVYLVENNQEKRSLLKQLLQNDPSARALVFTRTKYSANRIAEQLNKSSIAALPLHGNKSQSARAKALKHFKTGALQVLVATNIAARGLDIHELSLVINFDLPTAPEDYIHRIGRAGRAGLPGRALSFVSLDELKLLSELERFIKCDLPKQPASAILRSPDEKLILVTTPHQTPPRVQEENQQGDLTMHFTKQRYPILSKAKSTGSQRSSHALTDDQAGDQPYNGRQSILSKKKRHGPKTQENNPLNLTSAKKRYPRRTITENTQAVRDGTQSRRGSDAAPSHGGYAADPMKRNQPRQHDVSLWDTQQPLSNENTPVTALFDLPRRNK